MWVGKRDIKRICVSRKESYKESMWVGKRDIKRICE